MIVLSQVRRHQPDGRQRHQSLLERREDGREAASRASRLDPVIGGTLGEVQRLRAVRKQRRVALAEIEATRVQLHQRAYQCRGGAAFRHSQTFHRREEVIIRKLTE